MPRLTQSEIHSNFSSASETWSEYRAQVIAFYDNYPHSELNDHITREFNKKIRDLGQAESLYISPYNAGLRYIGDGVFTVDPLSFNPYFYIDAASSMLGVLESPSLDLNPAVPSTLDIITATRAGTATYTDASGNIQTASPNTVRVDHVQGAELTPTKFQHVGNTDFSDWIQASSTTLTDGSGYFGQPSKIFTASGGTHRVFRSANFATTAGTTYTGSVLVRRVAGTGVIQIYHPSSAQGNLTNITSEISEEWTRVEVNFTGHASNGDVSFGVWINVQGDAVEIARPQVEEGTTASDFVANTTGSPKLIAAATYAPRVPMMLIEPAATNLVTNTDFSDWTSSDVSVTDGSGYKGQPSKIITRIAGSFQSLFYHVFNDGDYTFSTEHTGSFWIRKVAGTNTQIHIDFYRASSSQSSLINLTEEWQKVEISFTSPSNAWFRFGLFFANNLTSLGDSVEIAMPQVEQGSVATSFIPTSGSAVTRAADDLIIDGSDFTNFYNQSEGTIYIETVGREVDFNYIYSISDGSSSNRILAIHHEYNHLFVQTSGVIQGAPDGGTFIAGTLCRYAASFKQNNLSVAIDGGNVTTDTSATLPTVNKINIGSRENGNELLNGHIKRLIYWPHHSDNI